MTDRIHRPEQDWIAYIDDELDEHARALLEERFQKDRYAQAYVAELRQVDELLRSTYQRVAAPERTEPSAHPQQHKRWPMGLVAAVSAVATLVCALALSIFVFESPDSPSISMKTIDQVQPQDIASRKVLLNTSSNQKEDFEHVLDAAERYLTPLKAETGAQRVEVLVHGPALQWLEQSSPAASRIATLERKYPKLSFRACGVAMSLYALKSGHEAQLLPQAEPVDAAIEEIVRKVSDGWLYVRG